MRHSVYCGACQGRMQHTSLDKSFFIASGFTLIELVLVIILISIISFIGMPKFFQTKPYRERLFHDTILSSLAYARKYAWATQCDIAVAIKNNVLQLRQRQFCNTGEFTVPLKDPSTNQTPYRRIAPKGIQVSPKHFYFSAKGKAMISGYVANTRIKVNDKAIQVVGETGYAYSLGKAAAT